MTSRAYPIWAMPFLDMGTGGQIIGQFTMPNQSEALARICNSRWTEFLYFAEESATAVAGYAPYLQTAPGVTGCVFGPSCADQWNNHNSVVIIGWDVEDVSGLTPLRGFRLTSHCSLTTPPTRLTTIWRASASRRSCGASHTSPTDLGAVKWRLSNGFLVTWYGSWDFFYTPGGWKACNCQ